MFSKPVICSAGKIGGTPLFKNPQICQIFGHQNLYIKDESANPTGTIKDRRSLSIIRASLGYGDKHLKIRPPDALALITYGNSGFSLATLAKSDLVPPGIRGMDVVCLVGMGLDDGIKQALKPAAYLVLEVNLSKKVMKKDDVIREIPKSAKYKDSMNIVWDVTNGYHWAYSRIAEELERIKPTKILVPFGSGETFAGVCEGVKSAMLKGVQVIGVALDTASLSDGKTVADKLLTKSAAYEGWVPKLEKEGHMVVHVADAEIRQAYSSVKGIIRCEPSAASVFAAIEKINPSKNDIVVAVNTGKGLFPPIA